MRIFIAIICLLTFSTTRSQKTTSCQALEAILEYKAATKPYYFDKNTSYPIIFYDTANVFKNCFVKKYFGRTIEVTNVFPGGKVLTPSDYIIIMKRKKKRVLEFILSYKSSGAYCTFTLKNPFKMA